ncbi:hypothetical protein GCM10011514_03720 [Emticicia aquatilis]|uniref:T9SS C-terminal target domain-containing protein n=1 Tax=Emticicia aquatilis TaxID=1537369 RepID=A0A916YG02_9BACT|nr:T9SS type A sorting domain-containing protein [Emticicia aquatilis]GGD43049.1 hypothetical protein GCM10011514_03720 [Emticicia aquatilis]
MKKVKILILTMLLLTGQGKMLLAQFVCGSPSPSEAQKKELLELFQKFTQQKNSRAITNYRVAVKANVVSANNASSFLSESDVRAIINNANTYLQNINIQLYLYNDKVYQIKNDQYADFKIVDEAALRQANDVSDAINIYFVKYITLQNLTILSGYAALPSYSASTNRIFYSYFERTEDDFNNLKNKTFLHEIGHYFGLLHTFQDSNNPDISKRELVTRGAGSNCVTTGDQLCDTPADPFERLPLIYAYNCDQKTPADLQDANGETFSPPIDNIMSYQQRCGNIFTEQQYQKMQASFAIRFSPLAEYQITARSANFLTINTLDKKVYCVGDSLKISFDLEGMFENNNQLFVDISDKNGKNFQRIESKFVADKIAIKLPFSLPEGDDYRVRLTATRPETISPISEHFAVRTYPNATISSTKSSINAGESTDLVVSLGGSGTWSFQLSDGTLVENFRQNSYVVSRTPAESTTYSVVSVKNMCGTGSTGNSASVNVVQPQIQAEALSTSTICQGQSIRLSISIVGKLSSNSQLVIQISDPTGNNFTDLPTQVSLFTLSAQIPPGFQTGTGYRIKVAAKNTEYFSSVLGPFSIITPPSPPVVVENYSFCQNSETSPLTATGTNLKWYTGELDVKPFLNITPPTGNSGTYSYYVSQSNSYGCESKRAKINVTIIPLATAIISGDVSMLKGDSTLLNVNLTGELPIELKLSDGRSFICNKTPFPIEVRPTKSTTYSIKEIKNSCGIGIVNGSAKITVLEPLADEEAVIEQVKVYPNPTSEQVFVEFVSSTSQNSSINIIDVGGKIIQTRNIKGLGKQHEVFDVSSYSAGIYFIKTDSDKRVSIKKLIIEK